MSTQELVMYMVEAVKEEILEADIFPEEKDEDTVDEYPDELKTEEEIAFNEMATLHKYNQV